MARLKPGDVGRLQGEIASARENMSDRHDLWRTVLDEYSMRNYETLRNAFSDIADIDDADFMASSGRVPHVNLYVRKMLGMVASRNNEYILDPRRPDQEVIGSLLEFAFEKVADKLELEEKMVETCRWALLFGTGIAKVGYGSEMVYGEAAWADKKPVGDVPEEESAQPYRQTTERNVAMSMGNPIMRVIPTFDYFKDPSARDDNELRREYVRYKRLLMDAKMDPRYSRAGREALVGFKTPDNEYLGDNWVSDVDETEDDALYCYVWEVVDIPSGQWCVIGETGDTPLIDWTPLQLPQGMRSPFIKFRPIPQPNSFWGLSYAALLLPSAMAMNLVKAQTIAQISRDSKKVGIYNPSLFDNADTARSVLQRAHHMQLVPANNLGETPGKPIEFIDFGGVNADLLRLQGMYASDLAQISQLTDPARNAVSNEQTATEANMRNAQQQISVSDMRSAFYKFHTDMARAICRIMLKEWPQSKMIKIMGADPRVYFWIDLDKQNVSEDFDIKIVMGTSEQTDRLLMRRQLTELTPQLVQLGQLIDQQKIMQQQTGQSGTFNYEGLAELLLDQFDPKFKNKILRKKDPVQMVIDMLQTKGIGNVQMSPMLMQQVQSVLSQGNAAMSAAQFTAQGGPLGFSPTANPAPQYTGMDMQDSSAFQSGRAASEAIGRP